MGYVEIIRPDGSQTLIANDGTVTQTPALQTDFCDKCQRWQPKEFGRFEGAQGISLLWFCAECK